MKEEELKVLKTTMPWLEQVVQTKSGVLVRMIDKDGTEVPLFKMTKFLTLITTRIAAKEKP